jgi:hypothetical protein
LAGERTALINQLRAILLERGYVAPQGKRKLEQFLIVLMDEQGGAGLTRLDDLRQLSQLRRRKARLGTLRPVVDEALRTRGG